MARLRVLYKNFSHVDLQMPAGVVGETTTYPFSIDKKDVREFLNVEEIDVAWVQLAILSVSF